MPKYIYQIICEDIDVSERREYSTSNQFVVGTFLSEIKANNVKDEMQKKAFSSHKPVEYRVEQYAITDWKA